VPTVLTQEVQLLPADCSLLHREFAAQLQFGFPAGVRLQFPFAGRPNRYTALEVFGGVEWTVLIGAVGVRTVFEVPHRNPETAFLFGPGIHGIYFQSTEWGHNDDGGGVLVDTTLGWVFDRHAPGSLEFGFNLGLGLIFTNDGDVFPIPTFGIYGGVHF
jgi:hypothetical protein